jgi:hypothetical protein
MPPKIYRLFITPQTHIRTVKAELWMFAQGVTDKYLFEFGQKKYDQRVEEKRKHLGSPNDYINRKKYIQKYFDYKRKLVEEFAKCGLVSFPTDNVWFRFFLPMPKSWSKKKRDKLCFEKHEQKPDASNFHKAIEDALCPKDHVNWDYRVSKFWIDGVAGYIEIEVGGLQPAIGYSKYVKDDLIK